MLVFFIKNYLYEKFENHMLTRRQIVTKPTTNKLVGNLETEKYNSLTSSASSPPMTDGPTGASWTVEEPRRPGPWTHLPPPGSC